MTPASLIAIAAASAMALPPSLRLGNETLAAASCAKRETLWIDHYVAALYVPPGQPAEMSLQDATRAKALEIQLLSRKLMPAELPRKYRRALEATLDPAAMGRVRAAYRLLQNGDVITVTYLPGPGVSLRVNGDLIASAGDHRVIDAVLVAWAGDRPLNPQLRATLAKHPCRLNLAG